MSIYAIDFDGTLCKNNWPEIGAEKPDVIAQLKHLQSDGHKLILWTCREGDALVKAINWCAARGLHFDAYNANLPERIAEFGNDPRKIGADYYLDDKNLVLDVRQPDEKKGDATITLMYCTKSYKPGIGTTKGRIYELKRNGTIVKYDNGQPGYINWRDSFGGKHLVPLVSRMAEPGEWVLVTDKVDGRHQPECHAGDVLHVACYTDDEVVGTTSGNTLQQHEYLVLDGYKPDEESEGEEDGR